MSWDRVIGQEKAKTILQKAIINNKVANAYLFHGIEGIGKDALAFEFAKVLNCPNPIIENNTIQVSPEFEKKYGNNIFIIPDIEFITALPSSKSTDKNSSGIDKFTKEQHEELKLELNQKQLDYYHRINISNANQIRIGQIRELKKKLILSNSNEYRKCIIISNAEKMSVESSNSLLKTLEEPKSNTTIILTCSNIDRILPTIKSRCQIIKCQPINQLKIKNYLIQKYNLSDVDANLFSVLSQGSISSAIKFIDDDYVKLRGYVIDLLRTTMKKKTYRMEFISMLNEFNLIKDKVISEIFLKLMILWFNDIIKVLNNQENHRKIENIINYDHIDILNKFAKHYTKADYQQVIKDIEKSINQINKNVKINLIYYSLFIKLRKNLLEK